MNLAVVLHGVSQSCYSQPMTMLVRPSAEDDLEAICAVYAHHVLTGTATFEEAPPSLAEMAARREEVLSRGLPHLVAELGGRVVGYSYAGPYRARSAYRFSVEDSVYLSPEVQGRGVGTALIGEVIAHCEAGPWQQMVAVIGDSANIASVRLHERLGFNMVGTLRGVGFKFGRWLDTVIMQREL